MIRFRFPTIIAAIVLVNAASCQAEDSQTEAADAKPSVAQQILGEWVIYRTTPDGKFKTVKEHRGDHSIVNTFDPAGNLIYSRRSDYKIETTGNVNVFRFSNSVILVGPNVGAKDPREFAYIFRVEGDQFLEVTGMMADDTSEPSLKVWRRLVDDDTSKD